jgi:iron complex transport system ATP-binding protein
VTAAARAVSFRYRPGLAPAVSEVDLDVEVGGLTALVGPNGSGKSTLLSLLGGLLRPDQGEVTLDGVPLRTLPRRSVAARVAYLPARPLVPADYTARELVLMGRHPSGRGLLLERPEDLAAADAALAEAGAAEFADRVCEQLSSGERQRVLLARVLCQGAGVLLLDEPTSAQDPAHAQDLFALLARRAREGCAVAVATHDLNAAARHADRLVVISHGQAVATGAPRDVLTAETLAQVFQVDALIALDEQVPYAVPRGRLP